MMTFSKDYRNTKMVHSYTYEWEKVQQYGGIVPPSKWKSQSLIGKLELRMRIGWSRPKNKHLPQQSWGSLFQILLLIWNM